MRLTVLDWARRIGHLFNQQYCFLLDRHGQKVSPVVVERACSLMKGNEKTVRSICGCCNEPLLYLTTN